MLVGLFLVYCSDALLLAGAIVGGVRYRFLPPTARLLHGLLICALAAETVGTFRGYVHVNPETIFNGYVLLEGFAFISGSLLLLRRPAARRAAWVGALVWAAMAIYQHAVVQATGFNSTVFLTQCVVVVAVYLVVLADTFLANGAQPMPTGMLLLCVAVLVYCSLAPLSFPATDYFYYKGKKSLAEKMTLINTASCILRYGVTLAAFILMPRRVARTPIARTA